MTLGTTHLVVLINGYDGDEQHVRENAEFILQLLSKYCKSSGEVILSINDLPSTPCPIPGVADTLSW